MKGYLVLENGEVFEGEQIGYSKETYLEVVFSNNMAGYIEVLTNPANAGLGIVMTYPLIGNYGVMPEDFESDKVWAKAIFIHNLARFDSNFRSKYTLDKMLRDNKIPGLTDINTRKLTRLLRDEGSLRGAIVFNIDKKDEIINKIKEYKVENLVSEVTSKNIQEYGKNKEIKVALIDYGFKHDLVNSLLKRDVGVTVFPSKTSIDEILKYKPDGIILSNGPGNPEDCKQEVENLKKLYKENIPILGIGLGHNLMAMALSAKVQKLKYGHRGANQPVKNVETGKVFITSQNHGYCIKENTINPSYMEVTHVNVNDKSIEGLRYKNKKIVTMEFEPGTHETAYVYDEFVKEIKGGLN